MPTCTPTVTPGLVNTTTNLGFTMDISNSSEQLFYIQAAISYNAGVSYTIMYDETTGFLNSYTGTPISTTINIANHPRTLTINAFPWTAGANFIVRIRLTDVNTSIVYTFTFNYTTVHLVASAVSSAELSAFAADRPWLMGSNVLRYSSPAPIWASGTATWSSYTPLVDANYPTTRLYDGAANTVTQATAASSTTLTLLLQTPYTTLTSGLYALDTVCILNHNLASLGSAATVQLQLCDTPDFSTASPVTAFSASVASNTRILITSLGSGNQRFTGMSFMRLTITCTSTMTSIPYIGELWMGRRRQLPWYPDVPYEDKASASDVADHTALSGNVSRYVRNKGRRDVHWTLRTGGPDTHGLDMETELRSWWSECAWGTQPSILVQRPTSAPAPLLVMPEPQFELPAQGPFERAIQQSFRELPPFWQPELAAANIYPV